MTISGMDQCIYSYKIAPGITGTAEIESAKDRMHERLSQLSAILNVMALDGFTRHSAITQADMIWLAASLMSEITALSPAALPDKTK